MRGHHHLVWPLLVLLLSHSCPPSFIDLLFIPGFYQMHPPAIGWMVAVAAVSRLARWQDLASGSQGEEHPSTWILHSMVVAVIINLWEPWPTR